MSTDSTVPTPRTAAGLDARTFLLAGGGSEGLGEAVSRAASGVPDIAAVLRQSAGDRVADVAAGFLDVDLAGVAVAGWRRHRQLVDAAHETLADPGLTVLVELLEHRTSCTWRPRIDVRVGGTTVAHLELRLTATVQVAGVLASVTRGRLTHVAGGRGELHAEFSLAEATLVERRAPFDPRLQVPLGAGLALLPRRPVAAPT